MEKEILTGKEFIPEQAVGSDMDVVAKVGFDTEYDAVHFFQIAKQRLLNVNNWATYAGSPSSDFYLRDPEGNKVDRLAQEGDHISIDIPGPSGKAGEGFDWVCIEAIAFKDVEDGELLSMTVRPAANPQSSNNDTAHFLTDQATSTFQVKRMGVEVFAEEHARNETPNSETDNAIDNARNVLVGWGAKIGLSYPQWKALMKGLLEEESP